jgi:hypothetical protein
MNGGWLVSVTTMMMTIVAQQLHKTTLMMMNRHQFAYEFS